MGWKLFDAATRVLICGAAVVLLTALAIPALIDLGIEEELVKDVLAAGLSAFVVLLLYAMLYAAPHIRQYTDPKAENREEAAHAVTAKNLICAFVSAVVAVVAVKLLDRDDADFEWLRTAIGAAIMTMGQVVAFEWQIWELQAGGRVH